jgi:anaerobic selenocysteine-containing dehydrogenase
VLPATTQFEHTDLLFSYYHFSVLLNRRAIAPVGECRSNLDAFRLLAEGMGYTDPCFRQNSWEIIDQILALDHPALEGVTLEKLLDQGWQRARVETADELVAKGRFPTPSGRIEFYSAQMQAHGHDPLPCYIPPRESRERTPDLYRLFPLHFLTSSAHAALNSNYAQHVGTADPVCLHIHPEDARPRGIRSGELVTVYNLRGQCRLVARVDDGVKPGVVACPGLWWDRQYPAGANPNHTTPDFTGDIGGGSAFNSNLVEVIPFAAAQADSREIRYAG